MIAFTLSSNSMLVMKFSRPWTTILPCPLNSAFALPTSNPSSLQPSLASAMKQPISKPIAPSMKMQPAQVMKISRHSNLSAMKVYRMNHFGTRRQLLVMRMEAMMLIGIQLKAGKRRRTIANTQSALIN